MNFTEARFFVLFAAAFAVYWSLKRETPRKLWLVACSCVFYGAWDVRFLALMLAILTLDWCVGRVLGGERPARARRLWLALSISGNLGVLGFFKYWNFFVDSAVELARWLGFHADARTLSVVLPIGISFYTFQSMSYTIDVYRRELRPARRYLDYLCFGTFFPQLVAGPIVRAIDFLPQLDGLRRWADVRVRPALWLFLVGYLKKSCIADQVSGTVDAVFKHTELYGAHDCWIAIVLYAVQIYCDFSGYSDMAIACAALLGYRLTLNFDFPYLATDIASFWRRWHISLSSWFRDYLYIPLGGNRRGSARTYFNLFLVFFLCGLWHGASWTFVVWGLMHGAALIVHRMWSSALTPGSRARVVGTALGVVLTPLWVLLAWVVFRASDFTSALAVWRTLFGAGAEGVRAVSALWWLVLAALLAVHLAARRGLARGIEQRLSDRAFAFVYGVCWALVLPWVATGYRPFIYYQF